MHFLKFLSVDCILDASYPIDLVVMLALLPEATVPVDIVFLSDPGIIRFDGGLDDMLQLVLDKLFLYPVLQSEVGLHRILSALAPFGLSPDLVYEPG